MKILHTADLHLGRAFNGISLEDDHAAVLDQILSALKVEQADVLVIAGDVFDRATPPAGAVRQFNAFLARVARETCAAVVLIAGNHDSADRIGAMAVFGDRRRALIRGAVSAEELPLVLGDAHGAVAFSALPFAYEFAARAVFGDESLASPDLVLRAQIAAARRHVPEGARWVVVAHGCVFGAAASAAERPLTRVGGVESVGADAFAGAHYVALGHLHRPQSAGGPHMRYAGAPLAFGFDEAGEHKSMSLVTLDAAGVADVRLIPIAPLRRVRVIEGQLADLLAGQEPSQDFVMAVLTDPAPLIDPMRRLRSVFPNACALAYARTARAPDLKALATRAARIDDSRAVIGAFLHQVRGVRSNAAEDTVIAAALDGLRQSEDAS